MSTVLFKTAAGQNAFTTAERTGDYIVASALGANEPTAKFIRAPFMQTRADYVRPAANDPLTITIDGASVTAYFVDDEDFNDAHGQVATWMRLWATIPAGWQEPGGTFAYTFPAYTSPVAFGTLYSVSNVWSNGNYYNVMTNAANIAAADTFMLDLNYVRSVQNYHVTFLAYAKFAGDGTRVPIGKVLPGFGGFSGVTGSVQEVSLGRTLPETIEVDSWILHEYALCDETTADILLPQVDKFSPVTSSGYETDTLSTGAATTPNSATYASMYAAGTLIAARRSDRRKYAGNIWERTTLCVKAR